MLTELFSGEAMLVEVVHFVWIKHAKWIVVVAVAVFALDSHQFAVFSQMLFQTFKTKLIHIAAKTFQTVNGAVAALDMSF